MINLLIIAKSKKEKWVDVRRPDGVEIREYEWSNLYPQLQNMQIGETFTSSKSQIMEEIKHADKQ